ncbi:DUF397 domain-containing protein [Streptomonospora wellingtoniae]|uniref:DUF397 domain-containing protein n=1 Tax=Streptomonospora wellingtoniae TaxID=3075544 RepID=A0ABU2L0G3_9ACTN|nr:DUF397 domain-containing protein [Streptomonospora sp. DSM 45055]MDT0305046.1 DUF397 domain-containing protein [Streptomonospora sp. DSM 45055]
MYQNQNQTLTFRKSSYSATRNDCVEVADFAGGSAVRDTKDREAGHLEFPAAEWSAFVEGLKSGGM